MIVMFLRVGGGYACNIIKWGKKNGMALKKHCRRATYGLTFLIMIAQINNIAKN